MSTGVKKGLLAAAVLASVMPGCVSRSYTIQTDPADAEVYVNGKYLGQSPVRQPFTFYGAREVMVRKEGYETAVHKEAIRAPRYEYFPLDFVSEVLYPKRIRDDREFNYALEKAAPRTSANLLERANAARKELADVPLNPTPRVVKKKRGHGVFPYPARERHWWHVR